MEWDLERVKRACCLKDMRREKRKHTVGLEPTISCSVGKRLIQLGYACLFGCFSICYFTEDTT